MSTNISTKVIIEDEGTIVSSNNIINFTGAGVSVSNVGGEATIVIPGPGVSTGLTYKGLWDANLNNPLLTSGVGTVGNYYVVSTAGTTNLDGTTDWQVGDWAIFVSNAPDKWFKIDNHDIQAYSTVKDESTTLPQRSTLKFEGTGVTATDTAGETVVTIPGNIPATTYGLYAQTALGTIITNTIVETSLIGPGVGTLSVPPNSFQVGDSFVAKMCGYISCANAETIHVRVKSDGVTIADAGVFSLKLATNKYFELSIDFTITKIGGQGIAELFVNGQYSYNHNAAGEIAGTNFALISNTVFDTTVLNTLSITAEWGLAKTANSIQSQNFVLNKIY